MSGFFRTAGITLAVLLALCGTALAGKRVALVIGNGAYANAQPLANPPRDARAMAAKLKSIGFEVIEGYDLGREAMNRTVQEFARAVSGADVGLFYYAGHGIQVNHDNYIVPVDARLADDFAVDFEITKISFVIDQMSRDVKLKLAFLDACRDNPLSRSLIAHSQSITVTTGMADMKILNKTAREDSLIAFATDPGNIALDGSGEHSPFTQALLDNIGSAASLSTVMNKVTRTVLHLTDNQQRPWVQASLSGDVFLNPSAAPSPAPPTPAEASAAPQPAQPAALDGETVFWNAARQTDKAEDYRAYLDKYPTGFYAPLARNALRRIEPRAVAVAVPPVAAPAPRAAVPAVIESSAETEAALAFDRDTRIAIQKRLMQLGFDPRSSSGDFDIKTRLAIAQWQKSHPGVPSTGYFDKLQYDLLVAQTGAALGDTASAAPDAGAQKPQQAGRQDVGRKPARRARAVARRNPSLLPPAVWRGLAGTRRFFGGL